MNPDAPQPSIDERTLGILNPVDGAKRFTLARYAPVAALASFVERYWIVRWDLTGQRAFSQEVIPSPVVNLAFERPWSGVHGPETQRFVAHLSGRGRVLGVKFVCGAFAAFTDRPMTSLIDRVLPVGEIFGDASAALARTIVDEPDDARAIHMAEAFLVARAPQHDDAIPLVASLVRRAQEDRTISTAADLARAAGMSVRSLHRLFQQYVGVGPKWVIRRSRVQEAAERVAHGEKVEWAALAQLLGYHDQAHLIRDFKAQVGSTPAAYAARCARAISPPPA